MNELMEIFSKVKSGEEITLSRKIYSIAPEDSFIRYGLHFSNTAKYEENPMGERFCGIFLDNKENIVVDGNGSTILIHGIMTPFIFRNCKNIVMKNFIIDHHRPTMNEFTILSSEKGKATIKIAEEMLYEIRDDMLYWVSENDFSGRPYWKNQYKGPKILTNQLRPGNTIVDDVIAAEGDWWHGFPDVKKFTEIEKGLIEIEFRDNEVYFAPETVIQTRNIKRVQTGGAIDNCENVTLENLRIMSMNCFGILAQNSKNIEYRNLDCTPKAGRTVVSDADFFHFSGCSGKVVVKNCKAKGAHDDIINIHGTHLKIIEINRKNNSVIVRYSHPESRGFNPYVNGDNIEFVCGNTLQPYFKTKVADVDQLSDTDFKICVEALPCIEPKENDVIENTTRTAELVVEENVFEQIPSRAILCTTRKDVTIKNNIFRNMGGPVLCVADDANFWFESGRGGNIYFENNTVINCGARELDKGCDVIRYEPVIMDKNSRIPVHKKLVVKNNNFTNTNGDEYTINLNYLESAEIENNNSNVKINVLSDGIATIKQCDIMIRNEVN